MPIIVQVSPLPHFAGLELPVYQTAASAGLDLPAAVAEDYPVTIPPGVWRLIPTGLSMALPDGYEAQIRPRSGLAAKFGISMVNTPGTIDADYRGEMKVNLINHGKTPFMVRRGDRIAQMIVAPVTHIEWAPVTILSETGRGTGGFGSTGV